MEKQPPDVEFDYDNDDVTVVDVPAPGAVVELLKQSDAITPVVYLCLHCKQPGIPWGGRRLPGPPPPVQCMITVTERGSETHCATLLLYAVWYGIDKAKR